MILLNRRINTHIYLVKLKVKLQRWSQELTDFNGAASGNIWSYDNQFVYSRKSPSKYLFCTQRQEFSTTSNEHCSNTRSPCQVQNDSGASAAEWIITFESVQTRQLLIESKNWYADCFPEKSKSKFIQP